MVTVQCDWCGKEFQRTRWSFERRQHNFCSRKCYGKWRSENLSGKNSPLWTGTRRTDAICQLCGAAFRPLTADTKRGFGKFCSRKCHAQWMSIHQTGKNHPCYVGDYVDKKCDWCSKAFTTSRYRAEKQNRRFCSRECHGKWHSKNLRGESSSGWKGGKVSKICLFCGCSYKITPSMADQSRFCSTRCHGKWKSENLRGENSPTWKGGPIKKLCEICNQEFETNSHNINRGWGRFCSNKCRGQWISKCRGGENAPTWLGGKSFEPYGIEFNNTLKKQIRERENFACALCKTPQDGRKLDVHHIDYDKRNNNPSNLIALCMHCHRKTNSSRSYWTGELSSLLKETYGTAL